MTATKPSQGQPSNPPPLAGHRGAAARARTAAPTPAITLIYEHEDGVSTAESLTETRLLWLAERRRATDHFARAVDGATCAPKSEPATLFTDCSDRPASKGSKR